VFEVAFVCTGNRFRSVLAAAEFRSATDGLPVHVGSYGTLELGRAGPLPEAVREGRVLGLDISAHRARSLRTAQLGDAGLVVGFELQHVVAALDVAGAQIERTFLLTELIDLLTVEYDASDIDPIARATEIVALAHARRRDPKRPRSIREIADPIEMADNDQRVIARTVYDGAQTLARELFPVRNG
jgi:protein-tyrosine-phosphatase